MRMRKSAGGLTVHAVAGTYVVMFGFDLPKASCKGLLGFTVHRTDHTENEANFMLGQKCFEATDPGFPAGTPHTLRDHPWQSFQYADYTAKPGHKYTYLITAQKGAPGDLKKLAEVAINITTEAPEGDAHDVYFNSGVAGSQAYVRRFGYKQPKDVSNNKAFEWLSRGLYEALEKFVLEGAGKRVKLRVAAYEFHYEPFLKALKAAKAKGTDVKVVYDARKDKPGLKNQEAVDKIKIASFCKERTASASYISHNKFIVKLIDDKPHSVWTGGTNFSEGGIYGHSNVAHVVRDSGIAEKYLNYWSLLHDDPENEDLKPDVETLSPFPANPAKGGAAIFSPRASLEALQRYASWAGAAKDGLFVTFAFGINNIFKDVYRNSSAGLRFALLEKKTRPLEKDSPERETEERAIDSLRKLPENVFAIGSIIKDKAVEGWVKEKLTGLNKNVQYVHNKFMLIDPLSDDPVVVAGSANFSNASTIDNDENMLVIRGNKRVADIYLGEFMRLYSHHAFRESLTFKPKPGKTALKVKWLRTDDWWAEFYAGGQREARRKYFS